MPRYCQSITRAPDRVRLMLASSGRFGTCENGDFDPGRGKAGLSFPHPIPTGVLLRNAEMHQPRTTCHLHLCSPPYPAPIRERAPCEEQTNFSARDTPITPSHSCTSHLTPTPFAKSHPRRFVRYVRSRGKFGAPFRVAVRCMSQLLMRCVGVVVGRVVRVQRPPLALGCWPREWV
jgi:hypothetical protein